MSQSPFASICERCVHIWKVIGYNIFKRILSTDFFFIFSKFVKGKSIFQHPRPSIFSSTKHLSYHSRCVLASLHKSVRQSVSNVFLMRYLIRYCRIIQRQYKELVFCFLLLSSPTVFGYLLSVKLFRQKDKKTKSRINT